jgi:hypothetical protein
MVHVALPQAQHRTLSAEYWCCMSTQGSSAKLLTDSKCSLVAVLVFIDYLRVLRSQCIGSVLGPQVSD